MVFRKQSPKKSVGLNLILNEHLYRSRRKVRKLGNITRGIFWDICQFQLRNIRSREACRPMTHEKKYLIDYNPRYWKVISFSKKASLTGWLRLGWDCIKEEKRQTLPLFLVHSLLFLLLFLYRNTHLQKNKQTNKQKNKHACLPSCMKVSFSYRSFRTHSRFVPSRLSLFISNSVVSHPNL